MEAGAQTRGRAALAGEIPCVETELSQGLTQRSASVLAQAIAGGEISSLEVVEAHIARIEAVNGKLNAIVVKRYDEARMEARAADAKRKSGEPLGPLHGVPCTIKECLDLAGTASTFGIPSRASHRATIDEVHVARLRAAGAITIAKTNVSQLLCFTEADNPVYGRTSNPWNAERTSGGSSGGEGAIIAAGGSPLGLGTDIGGSVRVPAAFCGIASLKPTAGRMPDLGQYSFPSGQTAIPSQVGVLARHVEDVALGFSIAASTSEGLPPIGDWRSVDVSRLRVGYYLDDGSFETAPAIRRAVEQAAKALVRAGAQLVPWAPPDGADAFALYGGLVTADGCAGLRRALGGGKRTPQVSQLLAVASLPAVLLPALRGLLRAVGQPSLARNLEAFGAPTADRYWKLVEAQAAYRTRVAESLDHTDIGPVDVILAPVCALPALTHGASRDLLTAGGYATLYNLLGYPAGVVPVTRVQAGEESTRAVSNDLLVKLARKVEQGSAGLPVGVQVIARPWREHIALAAMQAIEQAVRGNPDFPRTPALAPDRALV
jgi:fatty acid amide hydrolase